MINLYAYQNIKRDIWCKQQQIEQLRAIVERVTPQLTGMPRGNTPDYTASIAELIDLQAELAAEITDLAKAMAEIMQAIDSIPEDKHKQVLYRYYVLGHTLERIAIDMSYSYWHIKKLKRDGLRLLNDNMAKNVTTQ